MDGSCLKTHEFCLTMAMETPIDKQCGYKTIAKQGKFQSLITHPHTVAGCIMHGPLPSSSFPLIPDSFPTSLNILGGQMGQAHFSKEFFPVYSLTKQCTYLFLPQMAKTK